MPDNQKLSEKDFKDLPGLVAELSKTESKSTMEDLNNIFIGNVFLKDLEKKSIEDLIYIFEQANEHKATAKLIEEISRREKK